MRSLRHFTARFDDRELRFLPLPARLIERWNGVGEALRMRIA